MNIASLSTSLNTSLNYVNERNAFSIGMLKKELIDQSNMGDEIEKLIHNNVSLESLVNPYVGKNIDIYI